LAHITSQQRNYESMNRIINNIGGHPQRRTVNPAVCT
jgi:hypothetical protein